MAKKRLPGTILIPDGDYDAMYRFFKKHTMWGKSEKIFLWFQITSSGDSCEKQLYMACNYYQDYRPSSQYGTASAIALGRSPQKGELRDPDAIFANKVFAIRVRTVNKTAKGDNRHPATRYSVIEAILNRNA